MKNHIIECLKNTGDSTFIEIDRYLENNNIDYKGTKALWFNKDMNFIMWLDINESYMNAILELDRDKIINIVPCLNVVLVASGYVSNLPIATKGIFYKKPHFIPCIISLNK